MAKGIGTPAVTRLVLTACFIFSVICLILAGIQIAALKKSLNQRQNELEAYQSVGLGKLNRDKVALEKQLKDLGDSYNEAVAALTSTPKSKMSKEPGDSLKFKEELHKVQTKLKEEGGPVNFQFPFWLGFEKYEHDLPTANDLPVKVKQLDIVKEIGNLALKCGATEITSVEFTAVKDISAEAGKKIIFKEFPVKVGLKCKNDNLIKFLYALSVSDIPFKVDYIRTKTLNGEGVEKGSLSVDLIVVAAIFP